MAGGVKCGELCESGYNGGFGLGFIDSVDKSVGGWDMGRERLGERRDGRWVI